MKVARAFTIAAGLASASAQAFFVEPPKDANTYATEYVNVHSGHCVMLTDVAEIWNGRAGSGWFPTAFRAHLSSPNRSVGQGARASC